MRVKRKILTYANLIEIDLENWSKFEIFASWQYLELTAKQELCPQGLRNLMVDIRNVFREEKLPNFEENAKEIRLFTTQYTNDNIDKSEKPWHKKNATRPPYKVWSIISKEFGDQLQRDLDISEKKRLRLSQAKTLLVWTRSCGARLEELVRLKLSDVKVLTMKANGRLYLDLNIRRSKSNRGGKRELHYKCVKNTVDPELCPLKCFEEYLTEFKWIRNDGDFIFPSSSLHRGRYINGGAIVYTWAKICKQLNLPPEHHPKGHSGHDCLLCLAYAKNKNPSEILDITQWNSMATMPHYIQGPKVDGLNVEIATTSIEELDENTLDVLEFNSRAQ